jgi:hypothetical protein
MSYFDDASLVMIPSGYKDQKVYSVKPLDGSGDLTFSRASSATRVASNGLIEKVRTNLILQSQAFNTTWTTNDATVTANTTANPLDGAVNADTITLTGGSSQKRIQQSIAQNGTYTQSVYLKAGTHQFVQFLVGNDVSPYVNFDLINGTRSGAFGSSANIVSVGNGWYRCSMSYSTSTGSDVYIWAVDSLSAARADATSSTGTFFAFGYQFETGDIATDYIATTTAAVSVGPVSGLPRLDYLNSTCPRLLLEPQRSNLSLYSEQLGTASYWFANNSTVTSNNAVSPDGYTNADMYTAAGSGNYLNASAISAGSNTVTFSVFAKAGTAGQFRIREAFYYGTSTVFNLATGTIISGTGTITNYGNGWYRCTHTQTYAAGETSVSWSYDLNGATSGTAYLFGAQAEVGAYATSYIPTLGTSVTRVADAAIKTGISSLIGQTEGTIFVDFVYTQLDSNGLIPVTIGADSSNHAYFYIEGNERINFDFYVAGSDVVSIGTATGFAVKGTRYKIAFAYKANDFAAYINGQLVGTDNSGAIAAFSNFYFGYPYAAGYSTPNTVNQALLFKTRLTNAQLAELTTL